jgi:tetratricopeptide (TPR) repeat protein
MRFAVLCAAAGGCAVLFLQAAGPDATEERLARHRNLGKAFYENPTTQNEAVEEFRKALALAPKSARERLNYGLALLRAAKTAEGVAELVAVQKQDPAIPHTWFNLGIAYKKAGEQEKAIAQFEQMVKLAPEDAISHYNLGAMYRLAGRTDDAIREFRTAAKLDQTLAAPHFQLFNLLRTSGRMDEAKPELEIFQRLKKQQEGAAIPEDVEWNMFAEVYDVMSDISGEDKPVDLKFVATTGTASSAGIPGDYNNDGVLDYCVVTANGVDVEPKPKTPIAIPSGKYEGCAWLDFDHDYDLDLVLLGAESKLLRNQGPAGFQAVEFPFVSGKASSGVTFRVVPDTKGFDFVVTYADREAVLYRDRLQGRYDVETLPIAAGTRNPMAVDLNHDGWIDLVATTESGTYVFWNKDGKFQPGTAITNTTSAFAIADLANRGASDLITGTTVMRSDRKGGFTARSAAGLPPSCATKWTVGDFDNDGRVDLGCGTQRFMNRTVTANSWVGVNLVGVKNLKLAFGGEVEVKAGARYQKRIYEGVPLVFGLGGEKQVDTVRITWPNGLIQNEIKQPVGKQYKYEEAQRLSGSCPIIWSWNGREFEYITDVLGVAPLGASAGDGQYFPVDNDEYVQISGKSLRPVNGEYRLRITEELSEVAYIDKLELIAVDHPADVSLYTNDKFKGPPFPEFKLYGARDRLAPVSAATSDGRDVLSRVLAKDGTYPDDFSRNMSGVADLHHLQLDFGAGAQDGVLVLSGWVDWADGSTFLGVAQHGKGGLIPPYLQMKDAQGRWRTVIEDMGMPAGKPKTIAVDLRGKWLSTSREVRIVTNLCVYWDEVFLTTKLAPSSDVVTRVAPLQVADLRFRGFSPAFIHPQRKQPERFTYTDAKPVSMWNPTPGFYTRYGDVRGLAAGVDDKMILMGSGDEIVLSFEELPPPPKGWTRDFLLLVDGWAKDRDANTAHGQSTHPLPFHAMSKFPYGPRESFPQTPEHRAYEREFNTRPALNLMRPLR